MLFGAFICFSFGRFFSTLYYSFTEKSSPALPHIQIIANGGEDHRAQFTEVLRLPKQGTFFGIGEKAIRRIIADHPEADIAIHVGVKLVIKRKKMKKFLNSLSAM